MLVSILSFEPNPDGTCRNCRGPLHPETWLCTRCGTAHGERNRCPHCRTVARTLPHPTLLHQCSVCGKPRFAPSPTVAMSGEQATLGLREAGRAHRTSTVLRMLGYAMLGLGIPGLLLTVVILLILMPGAWVTGIALAFAVLPLLVWLFLRIQSKEQQSARERSLDEAYSQAILALLRGSQTERDMASIAEALKLPMERAERLMTKLNVQDQMTSRITDDGELLFGVSAPGRVRLDDASPSSSPIAEETGAIVDAELGEADDIAPSRRRRS